MVETRKRRRGADQSGHRRENVGEAARHSPVHEADQSVSTVSYTHVSKYIILKPETYARIYFSASQGFTSANLGVLEPMTRERKLASTLNYMQFLRLLHFP
jgi:hypothetical protein